MGDISIWFHILTAPIEPSFQTNKGRYGWQPFLMGAVMGFWISLNPTPFFDISDQILLDIQYGLMGMAFHPNFMQNGRFFLSEPEIWALGFRNPRRCSFDSERPSYFLCGDCGQVFTSF